MDPEAQALMDSLTQQFSQARSTSQSSDWGSIFQDALTGVNQMTPPNPQPVPGRVNPLGAMGSTFAATLADMMGAHGAEEQNQQRITHTNEKSDAASIANFARQEAFNHEKTLQRLGILIKIGDARAKQLEQTGDLDKYEMQIKSNLQLTERAKKLQQQIDEAAAKTEHGYKMQEIFANNAGKKDSPEEKAAKIQDQEDKTILKFQEDISNVARKPGATEKVKPGMLNSLNPFADHAETTRYTTAGIRQVLGRSAAVARSAGSPRLRQTALETYAEMLQSSGKMTPGSPDVLRLFDLAKKVFPNDAERLDWLQGHGF